MSRIFVAGIGAVSPAGWTVTPFRAALEKNEPLAVQTLERPGWDQTLRARLVPNPLNRPDFMTHPRLRRASQITHYAAAATLEALAPLRANPATKGFRLGLIACLQSGCVQYSCRFYDETLKNPATASPLIFPETVYAAPASHVAALVENVVLASSLVGDPSAFLQGISLAADWLGERRVDACLIIGAEEPHWIIADAMRHLNQSTILASGAGAVCLCRDKAFSIGVELGCITDAHAFSARHDRKRAASAMREQLDGDPGTDLLSDGVGTNHPLDAAESAAWSDWTGIRLSPKQVLGEGMMAAAAWQCVAACDAVATGRFPAANVSLVGPLQQAIGARFIKT